MTHAALIERLTRRAVRSTTVAGLIDETFESPQLLAREAATTALAEHDDVPVTVFEHEDGSFSVAGNTHAVLMSPTTTDVVALDLDETLASMKVGEFWGLLTSVSSTDPDHVLFVTGRNKDRTPKGVAYDVDRNKAAIASFKGYNGRFVKLDPRDLDGGAKAKIATKLKGKSFEDFTESTDEGFGSPMKKVAGWTIHTRGRNKGKVEGPKGETYYANTKHGEVLLFDGDGAGAKKVPISRVPADVQRAIKATVTESIKEARDPYVTKTLRLVKGSKPEQWAKTYGMPKQFNAGKPKKPYFIATRGEFADWIDTAYQSGFEDGYGESPIGVKTKHPLDIAYVDGWNDAARESNESTVQRFDSLADMVDAQPRDYSTFTPEPGTALAKIYVGEFGTLDEAEKPKGKPRKFSTIDHLGNKKIIYLWQDGRIRLATAAGVPMHPNAILASVRQDGSAGHAKEFRELGKKMAKLDDAAALKALKAAVYRNHKIAVESVEESVDEAFRPLPYKNEGYGFYGAIYTDVEMADGHEFASGYDATKAHADASKALATAMLDPTPVRVRNVLDSRFGRHFAHEVAGLLPQKVTAAAMKKAITRALAVKWVAKTLNNERKLAPLVTESVTEDAGDVPLYFNLNSLVARITPSNAFVSQDTAAMFQSRLETVVYDLYPQFKKTVAQRLKRDRKLTQALKADGFKLSESTVPQGDPTMTVRIIDDESPLAEAEGYYEGIEDDLAIDELEDALAEAIGSAGNEHLPAIEQFEALCNEGEYVAAQDVGIGLLESILDEKQLDELKRGFKFNAGQRAMIARRRKKAKTGTQKIELRKRRKEARKSINKLKRKRFRKMNKARIDRRRKQLSNSTEPTNPHAELFVEMAALGFTHAILIDGEEPMFSKDAAHAAEIAEDDNGEVVKLEEGKIPPQFLSKQKGKKGKAASKKDDDEDGDDTDESAEESALEITEDCYDDDGNLDVLGESAAAKMARAVTKFLRKHPRTGHGELATRFGIGQARAREVIDTVAKLGKAKGDAGSFEMVAVRVMDKLMQAGAKPSPAKGARVVMKPAHKVMKTGRMESAETEGDENVDEAGYGGITKGGDGKPAHGAAGKKGDKTSGPGKGDAMRGPKPSYKGQTGAIKDDVKEAIEQIASDNGGTPIRGAADGDLIFTFESTEESGAFLSELDENELLDFEIEARVYEGVEEEDAVRVLLTLPEGAYEYDDGDKTKVTTHPGVKGKGAAPTAGAKKLKRSARQDKNASEGDEGDEEETVEEATVVVPREEAEALIEAARACGVHSNDARVEVANSQVILHCSSEQAEQIQQRLAS